MKKTMRSAMLSTIAMLVVAVLSLTGVTYAWFSSAEKAVVSEFTMNVAENAGGVEISNNMTTWASSIAAPSFANATFSPVSTGSKLVDNGLKFFVGTLGTDTNTVTLADAGSDASGKWVAYTVYFRNTSSNAVKVNLNETTVTSADALDVEKATRIGLVDFGDVTITADNGNETAFNGKGATGVQIYEPNATAHTINGINDGAVANTVHEYFGAVGVTNTAVNRKQATTGVLEKVTTATDTANVTITINGNSYHKVVVYFWVEGQDADCQNDVAGENFQVNLKFSKVNEQN